MLLIKNLYLLLLMATIVELGNTEAVTQQSTKNLKLSFDSTEVFYKFLLLIIMMITDKFQVGV